MTTGSLVLSDGWYEGEIENNLPHGYGFKRYKNETLDEGYFCKGQIVLGKRIDVIINKYEKFTLIYQGQFSDNLPHGNGRQDFLGGMFRGNFSNGEPQEGVYFYPDGTHYNMNKKG